MACKKKKLKSKCCKKFAKKAKACASCPLAARLAPAELKRLGQELKKSKKKVKDKA
jgi:hypothetical protein